MPTAPTAAPAPNAAIATPTAPIPFATCTKFAPSISANDASPSANNGNASPISAVAPATPAAIIAIEPDNIVAPSNILGLANAFNPVAAPFITPAPILPKNPPMPAPALDMPPPPLLLLALLLPLSPPPPNNPLIPDISAFLTVFKANKPTMAPTISPEPDHNISLSQPPIISPMFKSPNNPLTSCSRTFPSSPPTLSPFLPPKSAVIKSKSCTFFINPVIVSDSV